MNLIEYRKIAQQVQADITAALAKHGLKVKPFGARIDERNGIVRMTIEAVDVNLKAADGSATTPEAEYWKQIAALYDLKPGWLGQEITISRRVFKIAGLLRGRKTKNVQIVRDDGKTFVTTPEDIARHFAFKEARKTA